MKKEENQDEKRTTLRLCKRAQDTLGRQAKASGQSENYCINEAIMRAALDYRLDKKQEEIEQMQKEMKHHQVQAEILDNRVKEAQTEYEEISLELSAQKKQWRHTACRAIIKAGTTIDAAKAAAGGLLRDYGYIIQASELLEEARGMEPVEALKGAYHRLSCSKLKTQEAQAFSQRLFENYHIELEPYTLLEQADQFEKSRLSDLQISQIVKAAIRT